MSNKGCWQVIGSFRVDLSADSWQIDLADFYVTFGRSLWQVPLACPSGLSHWHVPKACLSGMSLWHVPLARSSGMSL